MARKKRPPFDIGDVRVPPGEQATLELPVAELYTHTTLTMPLRVMHGRQDGPTLFVNAALHGDEINGVEIIRRLVARVSRARLRGTLLIIPVVNVFGFIDQSRYLPDRRDLNRSFPGSEKGSMASRLAWLFMNEVVKRSSYGIDLHTGSHYRSNLPQIRACLDSPEILHLAERFGAPVILDAALREGSLRAAAREADTQVLVYEAGEPLTFDELGIRSGVKGILAVMRAIGMLPARKSDADPPTSHVARSSTWTRAPQGGILQSKVRLGDQVMKGDVLGVVSDTFGDQGMDVVAKSTGLVIGAKTIPLVNEGAALFNIANFPDPDDASASVEAFYEEAGLDDER